MEHGKLFGFFSFSGLKEANGVLADFVRKVVSGDTFKLSVIFFSIMLEDVFATQLNEATSQIGRTTFTRLSMLTHKLQMLVDKNYVSLSDDEDIVECWQNMIKYAQERNFVEAARSCREVGNHIQKLSKQKDDLPYQVALQYEGVATELQFL